MVRLTATNYKTGESVDLGRYSDYRCAANALLEEVDWDEDDIPGHWHFDISADDGRTGYEELGGVPVIGVMCTLDDFMNAPEGGDEDDEDEYDFEDDVDETNYDPYMGCDFWDDGNSFEGWD